MFAAVWTISAAASATPPTYKDPLGLAVDQHGEQALVALHAARAIAVVDLQKGSLLHEIPVGAGPYDIALHDRLAFLTCEESDEVVRVDLVQHRVTGRWPTAQAPRGVAVHPDGKRIFVACHDARVLQTIDLATGKAEQLPLEAWPERVLLLREAQPPSLLILSTDERGSLVNLASCEPRLQFVASTRIPGISNARGLASKPGGPSFVFLVHQQPRDKVPATQVAQGWVFTNAVTTFSPWVKDASGSAVRPAKVLDEPGRAYADPSDVALAPDHRHVYVACAGADAVLALRTDRLVNAKYGPLAESGDGENIHVTGKDDLSQSRRYVVGRIPTQANPRRLALSGDGKTLVVSNTLDDSLTVIDAPTFKVRRHIALGDAMPDAARRGKRLFHSARMTVQGQFTCASCHPGGGADGLNWDLARDGLGNFLNTRSLRGVADTAPYGWHGTSPTLADRVTGTLRMAHHHEPTGKEVEDLTAYLKTLKPERPLPLAADARAAAARGKLIFEGKAKCSACHQGDTFSDTLTHDVGTRIDGDLADSFDTPSLRGVARTAPYLHHGQAATLEEIFSKFNDRRRHGGAHLLTPAEMDDVVTFLKSL
jgi:cytochrome c peroxidase